MPLHDTQTPARRRDHALRATVEHMLSTGLPRIELKIRLMELGVPLSRVMEIVK